MQLPFELLVTDLAAAIMTKLLICGATFFVVSGIVGFLLYVICALQSIRGSVASVKEKLAKFESRKDD